MAAMISPPRPDRITGGCLCGSVRYTIRFSQGTKWPPESGTCECTMCRKWTASLLPQFLALSPSQLSPWPLNTYSSYIEYESSPRRWRGFCSKCGSSLVWRSEDKVDMFDLFLGTIDEKWLVQEKEIGKALAMPNQGRNWCENTVDGVTDLLKGGRKFLREDDGTKEGRIDD